MDWDEGQVPMGRAAQPRESGGFFSDGILRGTPVATAEGWRPVETVSPGDLLLTFDDGLRPVAEVMHTATRPDPADWPPVHWPLALPQGVLGNSTPLRLLPDQLLLLESDRAEEMFGDPFALLPARALEGWRGIAGERPVAGDAAVILLFAAEQVIYAQSSLLLHCPGQADGDLTAAADLLRAAEARYAPLSLTAARQLAVALMAEDVGAALSQAAREDGQAAFAPASNRP